MENLKKSIFDNREVVMQKNSKIDAYLKIEKDALFDREIALINNIVKNISFALPRESFSCKHGVLIYTFKHEDKDREVYISPEVYLIDGDCVVYEVINHKQYYKVTNNQILISQEHKYFCEIPLKQFLKYVCAEDIINFIEKQININYEEYVSIQKRIEFVEKYNL